MLEKAFQHRRRRRIGAGRGNTFLSSGVVAFGIVEISKTL